MALRPRVITARDVVQQQRTLAPVAEDSPLSKIVKYIPAEMVALYTALRGIIITDPSIDATTNCTAYKIIFLSVLILTPFYMYISTREQNKETPWFHVVIATVSFCIWVYSFGDIFQWCWIIFGTYSSKYGAIVLLIFTAAVPALEKLFIKPNPQPVSPE
jgi:hypothetical protein